MATKSPTLDGGPENARRALRPRVTVALAVAWWIGLLLQVWFAWDLSEFYSGFLLLLLIGPETPFGALGILLMALRLPSAFRERRVGVGALCAVTLVAALWVTFASPVFDWGTRLYLLRHEDSFESDVVALVSEGLSPEPHTKTTQSGRRVHIEGDPLRIAFERRWIGGLHWAAFVYDPDRTLERGIRRNGSVFGRWGLLGYEELWGDWWVVFAIK